MGKDISRSLIGSVVIMACAGTILSRALEPSDAIPAQREEAVSYCFTQPAIKTAASVSKKFEAATGKPSCSNRCCASMASLVSIFEPRKILYRRIAEAIGVCASLSSLHSV